MHRLLILSIFVSLFSFSFLQAQNTEKVEEMLSEMETTFSLTPSQSQTIRYILEDVSQQLRGIRYLRKSDPKTFRQKKRSIMQRMDTKILASLDETQAADYRAMRENSRNKTQTQAAATGSVASKSLSGSQSLKSPKIKPAAVSTETESFEAETYTEETEEESYSEEETFEEETISEEVFEEPTDTTESLDKPKEDMLERTLDFLYEGFVRPAVQNRKKKKDQNR